MSFAQLEIDWDDFKRSVGRAQKAVSAVRTANLNKKEVRDGIDELVMMYMRFCKAELEKCGISVDLATKLVSAIEALHRLASTIGPTSSFKKHLRALSETIVE